MPKITAYQQQTPDYGDFLLGVDSSDTSVDPAGQTVKFPVSDFGVSRTRENIQTGATYTLGLVDQDKIVMMNSASSQTVNLPLDSAVPLPVGFTTTICQEGVGVVTIDAATGVTLRQINGGSGQISARYGTVTIYKRSVNEWVAIGAIGAVT